jgi:Flp pilus assembly protein TadD
MAKRQIWGRTLTAIGLVGVLAACSNSSSGPKSASANVDVSKVGLAMRAQAALVANDLTTALSLGEAAVEHRPKDATFRALLGNIYLASGRYASAERSYHDALTLAAPDPQVVLKYALVQLAQGKTEQAVAMLGEAQTLLDPADLGLALAIAGRANDAIAVLEPAARMRGADARTRQNLALAHALGGDWQSARIIAAQDLAADQVEARMAEWLTMARPGQASAQVAAFIGVQPVADPGQPTRLALAKPANETRAAAVTVRLPPPAFVAPQPAPVAPAAPVAYAAPAEPIEQYAEIVPPPMPPMPAATVEPQSKRLAEAPRAKPAAAAPRKIAAKAPRPALSPAAARLTHSLPELRRDASLRTGGNSRVVVQLGAFDKREFVAGAWNRAAGRHAALRNYTPVTARFDSGKGTFYRLSVKGFASDREAAQLCNALKRAGTSCFVRAAFNDAPVQLALR